MAENTEGSQTDSTDTNPDPNIVTIHKPDGTKLQIANTPGNYGIIKMFGGGSVPGKAPVKGDSPKNDTVKTVLSAHEIVIPRHITQGPNPVAASAEFVRQVLAGKGPKPEMAPAKDGKKPSKMTAGGTPGYDVGGDVAASVSTGGGDAAPENLPVDPTMTGGGNETPGFTLPAINPTMGAITVGASPPVAPPPVLPPPARGGYVDMKTGLPIDGPKDTLAKNGAPEGTKVTAADTGKGSADAGKPLAISSDRSVAEHSNKKLDGALGELGDLQDTSLEADQNAANVKAATDFAKASAEQIAAQNSADIAAAHRATRDQEINKRIGDIDAATAKLDSMSVDPSKAFGEGVTFSKVLAGIGISLGAIGQSRTGQPNQAVDIIHQAIKTDIEAQKANIQKQEGVIRSKNGGLQTYLELTHNEQSADQLEEARQMGLVAKRFEMVEAANRGTAIGAMAAHNKMQFKSDQAHLIAMAYGTVTTDTTKSMLPSMMKTDLPPEFSKQIVEHEGVAKNLSKLADKIEADTKKGVMSSPLTRGINKLGKYVGADDPDVSLFDAQLEAAGLDMAGIDGFKRQSGVMEEQKISGKPGQKNEAIVKQLRSAANQNQEKADNIRGAFGATHRMPASINQPNATAEDYGGSNLPTAASIRTPSKSTKSHRKGH
jgi:hypothetical protein